MVLSGYDVRLCIKVGKEELKSELKIETKDPLLIGKKLDSPNGCSITFGNDDVEIKLQIPPIKTSFVLNKNDGKGYSEGRAGMMYRDLVPDRLGGK